MTRAIEVTYLILDHYPPINDELVEAKRVKCSAGYEVTWVGPSSAHARWINSVEDPVMHLPLAHFVNEEIQQELVKLKFYTDPKAYE